MKHGQLRMQPTNECQGGCKHCTRALKEWTAPYKYSKNNSSTEQITIYWDRIIKIRASTTTEHAAVVTGAIRSNTR